MMGLVTSVVANENAAGVAEKRGLTPIICPIINIGCVAVLLGMMGIVTEAAAMSESKASLTEKRGLSPITNDEENQFGLL